TLDPALMTSGLDICMVTPPPPISKTVPLRGAPTSAGSNVPFGTGTPKESPRPADNTIAHARRRSFRVVSDRQFISLTLINSGFTVHTPPSPQIAAVFILRLTSCASLEYKILMIKYLSVKAEK